MRDICDISVCTSTRSSVVCRIFCVYLLASFPHHVGRPGSRLQSTWGSDVKWGSTLLGAVDPPSNLMYLESHRSRLGFDYFAKSGQVVLVPSRRLRQL